jgi:hypothetical protein
VTRGMGRRWAGPIPPAPANVFHGSDTSRPLAHDSPGDLLELPEFRARPADPEGSSPLNVRAPLCPSRPGEAP